MSKRPLAIVAAILLFTALIAGCGEVKTKDLKGELKEDEINIVIPSVEREYTFVFVSDLHIIDDKDKLTDESQIYPEKISEISERKAYFTDEKGMTSHEKWKAFPKVLDSYGCDGILFGGDMIDFYSDANIAVLKEGLDSLQTPYMYIRSDHDYGTWNGPVSSERVAEKNEEIDGCEKVKVWEYPSFVIMGIDNSTSPVTDEMLAKIRKVFELAKPIIVLTHVPFDSTIDPSLEKISMDTHDGRNLTWGIGCYYSPDDNMQTLLHLLYDENSPVVEVVCGHLHLTWDGEITKRVSEHIFDAAYKNNIGIIKITSK